MTKKASARFSYIKPREEDQALNTSEPNAVKTTDGDELKTVPKGEGRMNQDRAQLNIRIPEMLKRRAGAKAMLEGRTLAEVVEEFLRTYAGEPQ